MAHRTSPSPLCQVARLRQQFTQDAALPFADILPADQVQQAVHDEQVRFRDRLFNPAVTVWMFLSQVLDACHCCRQTVARFLAWRLGQGLAACSADTSAYCKARGRLPEALLARLVRQTGQRTQDEMPAGWRWAGRTVKVVDGTTVSMPDTPANQQTFPQSCAQKAGVGFPLARMVVLFSLAVGTALDAALGPYRGKQTGELSLFRQLHDRLDPGDILLADRHYCSFWELALVRQRGGNVVTRLHQLRKADFRRGRRRGHYDHVVTWTKPCATAVDDARGIRPTARNADRPRVACVGGAARLPHPRADRGHDAVGCGGLPQAGRGVVVSCALVCGDRPSELPLKRQPVPRRRRRLESP